MAFSKRTICGFDEWLFVSGTTDCVAGSAGKAGSGDGLIYTR